MGEQRVRYEFLETKVNLASFGSSHNLSLPNIGEKRFCNEREGGYITQQRVEIYGFKVWYFMSLTLACPQTLVGILNVRIFHGFLPFPFHLTS